MEPKILKNESDYAAALEETARLMSAKSGTRDAQRLELWSFLVEEYEKRAYPIDPPDPVDAILFRMDQQG